MAEFSCARCADPLTVPVSRVALPDHAFQRHGYDLLGTLLEPGTYAVSTSRGVVVAPGHVRGTVIRPEPSGGACCGLRGADGPNLACERCGHLVATRIDDCGYWPAVWLAPGAVEELPGGPDVPPLIWAELRAQRPGIPPVEPRGWWSPVWTAAVAVSLAHLPAVSGGARMGPAVLAPPPDHEPLPPLPHAFRPDRQLVLDTPARDGRPDPLTWW